MNGAQGSATNSAKGGAMNSKDHHRDHDWSYVKNHQLATKNVLSVVTKKVEMEIKEITWDKQKLGCLRGAVSLKNGQASVLG